MNFRGMLLPDTWQSDIHYQAVVRLIFERYNNFKEL